METFTVSNEKYMNALDHLCGVDLKKLIVEEKVPTAEALLFLIKAVDHDFDYSDINAADLVDILTQKYPEVKCEEITDYRLVITSEEEN